MESSADESSHSSIEPGVHWSILTAYGLIASAFVVWSVASIAAANLLPLFLLLSLALLANRLETRVGSFIFSGEFVPILVATFAAPHIAVFVAGSAFFGAAYKSASARIVSGTSFVISAGMVGALMDAGVNEEYFGSLFVAVACAGIVFLFANILLVFSAATTTPSISWPEVLPLAAATIVSTAIFNFPIVAGIVWAYRLQGLSVLPFIFVPLFLVQYFHNLYRTKVTQADELVESAKKLAKTNIQFAAAMVRALDARDAYTAGHSAAVAVYTRDIAREVGFGEKSCRLAHLAGLLHDIGKIGVPGSVLNKQARLTDEEFEQMKAHAAIGASILAEVDAYSEISMLVRHHHERIDGNGYPDKIAGDMIPEISRMISVADTYSAMTTDRPYRKGLDPRIAVEELTKHAATQLDFQYVTAFVRILMRENDAYRRGKLTSFDVEVAKHEAMGEFEAHILEQLDDGAGAQEEKAA